MPSYSSTDRYGLTLADLMRRRGDEQAALELRRGDIAAQGWQKAGSAITNAVSGWQQDVQRNRQLELEAAREARRVEAEDLQIESARMDLDTKKRKQKGEETSRAILPLARRPTGVVGYDRDLIQREMEAAGFADQVPDIFARLDEQEAGHLKVIEARREAIAGDAWRVLRGGDTSPETFNALVDLWGENDLAPKRELDLLRKAAETEGPERALLAAVESSPKFAELVQQARQANAPKLLNVPEGGTVINERTGDVLYQGTPKAPTLGSFEDYVKRKYGENPTPDQITEARKVYQQADDRPININTGQRPLTQSAEAQLIGRYQTQWSKANQPVRDLDRQLAVIETGLAAARRGDMAQANEAVLQPFLKILDPNSVVREGEFMRLREGQPLVERMKAAFQRLGQGGFVTAEQLEKYAQLAREIRDAQAKTAGAARGSIQRNLDRYNIPHELVFDAEAPSADTSAPAPIGEPQTGERRMIQGQLAEWDGKGWKAVK